MAEPAETNQTTTDTTPNLDTTLGNPQATTTANTPRDDKKNNRFIAFVFLALFFAPIIIAYTILKTDLWQSFGSTNQGELLNPPVSVTALTLSPVQTVYHPNAMPEQLTPPELAAKTWQLFFIQPDECDLVCQNSRYVMQQVHTGLGPTQHRVQENILVEADQLTQLQITLQNEKHTIQVWQWQPHTAPKEIKPNHLYIADPLGNIMLQYQFSEDHQTALMQAKGLLKDLKKLLKLSRIG